MRIIAGKYRGRPLAALGKGDAGAHLRPTSDRVRESLFSMLTHHDVIKGARVLDLFAGTGALTYAAVMWVGYRELVDESLALIRRRPLSVPEPGDRIQTTSG